MYGDGNSSKLMKDIMNTLNQVTDGLKESTGIDLSAVLAGFAGAKIADSQAQAQTQTAAQQTQIQATTQHTQE